MRLPRDVSGTRIINALRGFGYEITRQTGSHIRLTTTQRGEHRITIPNHNPIGLEPLRRSSMMSLCTSLLAVMTYWNG